MTGFLWIGDVDIPAIRLKTSAEAHITWFSLQLSCLLGSFVFGRGGNVIRFLFLPGHSNAITLPNEFQNVHCSTLDCREFELKTAMIQYSTHHDLIRKGSPNAACCTKNYCSQNLPEVNQNSEPKQPENISIVL